MPKNQRKSKPDRVQITVRLLPDSVAFIDNLIDNTPYMNRQDAFDYALKLAQKAAATGVKVDSG